MAEVAGHRPLSIDKQGTSPFAHFEYLVLRPHPMGSSAGIFARLITTTRPHRVAMSATR